VVVVVIVVVVLLVLLVVVVVLDVLVVVVLYVVVFVVAVVVVGGGGVGVGVVVVAVVAVVVVVVRVVRVVRVVCVVVVVVSYSVLTNGYSTPMLTSHVSPVYISSMNSSALRIIWEILEFPFSNQTLQWELPYNWAFKWNTSLVWHCMGGFFCKPSVCGSIGACFMAGIDAQSYQLT
jgi:hypothetical protein